MSNNFKNIPKQDQKHVNCVLMNGGVGDHVGGSLIAIDYIRRTYPWINLLVWTPDFLVEFAKNVIPKGCVIRGYSDMEKKYDSDRTTINTRWDGRVSPMKQHQTDYAFQVLCDERVTNEEKNYLRVNTSRVSLLRFNLPARYAVLATGFTAGVREFTPEAVNPIIDYLISNQITPVFLGASKAPTGFEFTIEAKHRAEINYHLGISLLDKTSLVEAAAVIEGAQVMIGVDCGLIHVAGCTDTPIVAGYTTVTPALRAPFRHNVFGWKWFPVGMDDSIDCRYCQVRTNFLYGHDYKNCLHKSDDIRYLQCLKNLTPEKFIAQIEKALCAE